MESDQELEAALEDYFRDSAETETEKELREKLDRAMIAWLEDGKEGLAKFLLELEGQEMVEDKSETLEKVFQEPSPPDTADSQ